jgi:hypothetical protein
LSLFRNPNLVHLIYTQLYIWVDKIVEKQIIYQNRKYNASYPVFIHSLLSLLSVAICAQFNSNVGIIDRINN